MSLVLDGTNGLSDIDGSAATPAIRGTDANTGIFFPAADTIAFAEGGTEAMRIDSSGNVGIGTSSPAYNLDIAKNSNKTSFQVDSGNNGIIFTDSGGTRYTIGSSIGVSAPGNYLAFNYYSGSAWSERARIDSSGNLLVGTTTNLGSAARLNVNYAYSADGAAWKSDSTLNHNAIIFVNPNGTVGAIRTNGSATSYNTSSDYRLKNTVAPMTGALAKVAALKPCTYKWNADGSDGEGFIAHELAEVCPQAVSGEKDAINEDGSINPQGIDTSFLVATLTAAIQELKAIVDAQGAEIAALKGTQP